MAHLDVDIERQSILCQHWTRRHCLGALLVVVALCGLNEANATSLARPVSTPLLVIKGHTGQSNVGGEAHLDHDLLRGFGVTRLRTWTPWTDGEPVFEGVLLRTLIEQLDAVGSSFRARALNDYFVDIPVEDAINYDVLLAWSANDIRLTRRDRGPLWVVYPWSDHRELDNRKINQRSIWQLYEMEFRELD